MRENMKYIALMDTAVMSFNLGDQIIMESAEKGLHDVIKNNFTVHMPTHSPLFHKYEFSVHRNDSLSIALNRFDYKFVCGTNLLEKDMCKRKNTWNLHYLDTFFFNNFVLMGVGTDELPCIKNRYTKKLYDRALSHEYIHSTRDRATQELLEGMGFQAVNTGCVTLWPLTPEHCHSIPRNKSNNVVFTLTDYRKDYVNDQKLIHILLDSYDRIYYWPQGINDLDYFNSLTREINQADSIEIISPSLADYNYFLSNIDCDYVGTRLHAGIKAMQKGKRSIILGVDNRAKDMTIDHHLNYISREDINELKELIYGKIVTDVRIDVAAIKTFLGQFRI